MSVRDMDDSFKVSDATIGEWLTMRVAQLCGVAPEGIDVDEPFSRYGLCSLDAMRLGAELSQRCGRNLAPTVFWEHPNIAALCAWLSNASGTGRSSMPAATAAAAAEPIAIVGMACRFPGAPSPDAFWELLRNGADAVRETPSDRWDVDSLYDADVRAAGKMNTRWGGFLDRIDAFDPQFFGISPREASQMDPQQRLMLELAWESLEDAGIPVDMVQGRAVGVFAGAMWNDYAQLPPDPLHSIEQHSATGRDLSIIAARISYFFDWRGPSLALNTACSSALVAVHYARRSLQLGECELALAGGVNLMLAPHSSVAMSKFGGMAPDGRSKAFDARANGYVRGEGGGLVVLKRLSKALADGDRVYCVIAGSAVNNDGASNGLSAPNPAAQEDMLREAYASAAVALEDVQYVEAHGTGTLLGDPIEAGALGKVLGAGRPEQGPLLIGSVKTNIGHLEAAAGIAGLIKVVLAMQRRMIPPSLHFESPNPHIPFADLRLQVQRTLTPWPAPERALCAGVSAFGFGGTNCHVVLRDWKTPAARLLKLSAPTSDELAGEADRLLRLLRRGTEPADGATDAARGHEFRCAITYRSTDELTRRLEAFVCGDCGPGVSTGRCPATGPGRRRGPVFVFSGQGSQWPAMGRALMHGEPVFRAALEACDQSIRTRMGWSLIEVLSSDIAAPRLDETDVAWPAIVAIEIALAALWRSWGIEPSAVLGHSIGEVAAAHVAGALDLDAAMDVICAQARAVRSMLGGMALVQLSWDETGAALERDGLVWRAIQAAPDATVVAGDAAALACQLEMLAQRQIACHPLNVRVAVHGGPRAIQQQALLEQEIGLLRPRASRVPFISGATASVVAGATLDAAYWSRNLGEPVLFADATQHLLREGHTVFLEVSAHPVVGRSLESTLRHAEVQGTILASLRRDQDERLTLLDSLGALFVRDLSEPALPEAAQPSMLPLSTREGQALDTLAAAYRDLLRSPAGARAWRAIAGSAGLRRSHLAQRLAVVAATPEEAADALDTFASGGQTSTVTAARIIGGSGQRVAFVFPGQGSQWHGMGRELMRSQAAFRDAVLACDAAMRPHVDWSLVDVLTRDDAGIERIDVIQPALFAVEVGLAALWRSWGIEPDVVLGHSMGEVAAAHVAGALSLEDAALVICGRSRLLRRVSGEGAMALVELSMEEAEQALAGLADRVSVAAGNAPRATVLSGDRATLERLLEALEQQGVFCRRIKVDVASHSPRMDGLRDDLVSMLQPLAPRPGRIPFFSTVTGTFLNGDSLTPAYWADNLRQPVRFSAAITELLSRDHDCFIELSPHPILVASIEEHFREVAGQPVAIPSLKRDEPESRTMLESLSRLYTRGHPVTFGRLYPDGVPRVSLPTYPWQRQRHWIEAAGARPGARGLETSGRDPGMAHPMLCRAMRATDSEGTSYWEADISLAALPYLADHRVGTMIVLPGTAFIELMLAAAAQAFGEGPIEMADLMFLRALFVPEQGARTVRVAFAPVAGAPASVRIHSRANDDVKGDWVLHVTATVRSCLPADPVGAEAASSVIDNAETLAPEVFYSRVAAAGVQYGPAFQVVRNIAFGGHRILGRLQLASPWADDVDRYAFHPALFDACLQVMAAPLAIVGSSERPSPFMPVRADAIRVLGRPEASMRCHVVLRDPMSAVASQIHGDLTVLTHNGDVVAQVSGMTFQLLDRQDDLLSSQGQDSANWFYEIGWRMAAGAWHRTAPTPAGQTWLIVDLDGNAALEIEALADCAPADVRCVPISAAEEGFDSVLRGALAAPRAPVRGVLCMARAERPDASELGGCARAIALLVALTQQAFEGDPPRLWFVTRGSQHVREVDEVPGYADAALWGLGRAISSEHPALWGGLVDSDPHADPARQASALWDLVLSGASEDQVAFRQGMPYVARLSRRPVPAAPPSRPLRPDAAYLITGGLGELGLLVARSLVNRGARHLLLLARTGLPPREQWTALDSRSRDGRRVAAVLAMEQLGATVTVVEGDVGHGPCLARAIEHWDDAGHPPLRGVFHLAGVLQAQPLVTTDARALSAQLGPKAQGAFNLHTVFADRPLDFFVLFSSAAGLLASPMLGAYAAANSVLDALACHRRARGMAGLSIGWGFWADVGMAARDLAGAGSAAPKGMRSFAPEQGIAILERLTTRAPAQIAVMPMRWPEWLAAHPDDAAAPVLADMREQYGKTPSKAVARAGHEAGDLKALLAASSTAQRLPMLSEHIAGLLGDIVMLALSEVPPDTPFGKLGLDSLMSLALRNRLEASLGLTMSVTTLWNYPTVQTLAPHLLEKMALGRPEVTGNPALPHGGAPEAQPTHEASQPPAPAPSPAGADREDDAQAIAIVGMGCRLPGGVDGPEAFWDLLRAGRDAVTEIPADRFDIDALHDPDRSVPGKIVTRRAAVVDGVDRFDAAFFGISPREASRTDPQQRFVLEVAWEALEHAGIVPARLAGSRTGVFVGVMHNDYASLQATDLDAIDPYASTGTHYSIIANRLSFALDLRGPSMAVDTACSSSLVAVHLAVQSLRRGESDLALAGGVNLILSPMMSISYSKWGMLSQDGRCYTFDSRANGFVRGEGCGVVVLKRLRDAIAAGDPIVAVIRGSAVNQDGRTNVLTAPSGLAQQEVARAALADAGIEAGRVGYVETHGTGTSLGDPIEVEALAAVYGAAGGQSEPQTCRLGAVKTQIGHLEGAAGVAGLIKAALCLQRGEIPSNLNFANRNPHIVLDGTRLAIAAEKSAWPPGPDTRVAAVSSFGAGGTNAHVVVQEYRPEFVVVPARPIEAPTRIVRHGLLPIAAKNEHALRALAARYRSALQGSVAGESLEAICRTAAVRRTHHAHRLAIIGDSVEAMVRGLASFERSGEAGDGVVFPARRISEAEPKVVFAFCGQGSQWLGMGRQLLDCEPVFRAAVHACDHELARWVGWSLLAELSAASADSRLDETEIAQPVLFALQVSLAALWRSWGIVPSAVIGHSVGEIAAAHVAGALTLEQAMRVVVERGRLMQEATGRGKMAAVEMTVEDAATVIAGYGDRLSIAAINDPASLVLSGEREALDEVIARLSAGGTTCRVLNVDYAFHSPQMEPFARRLGELLDDLAPRDASIPVYSSVTGLRVEATSLVASYWARNVLQPVQFVGAVGAALQDGYRTFLELGPHPALGGNIRQCLRHAGAEGIVVGSLRRERDEARSMMVSLAQLHAHGCDVDWTAVYPCDQPCVALPTYAWQQQRYWLPTRPSASTPTPSPSQTPTPSLLAAPRAEKDSPPPPVDGQYEVVWKPLAAPVALQPGLRRTCLLLADHADVSAALLSALRERGHAGLIANDPAQLVSAVQAALAMPSDVLEVVHLRNLDEATSMPGAPLDPADPGGCCGALRVLQALLEHAGPIPSRLWIVTQGAIALDPDAIDGASLQQATLWGLGKVIALEHPEHWGGLVDLDPRERMPQDVARCLADTICADSDEHLLALRRGRRFGMRVATRSASVTPASRAAWTARAQATYLVTGGLGGLGLETAHWLVECGARSLVLLGRRAPTDECRQRLSDFERRGVSVLVLAADVSSPDDMARVFQAIAARGLPALRGIVHAAGVIDIKNLSEVDPEEVASALAAKTVGAWLLHEMTLDIELDCFVLFSSIAAVWGARGHGTYAAANAFLDALAHHRRGRGLAALSINWGPWERGGMATGERLAQLDRVGIDPLRTAQAFEALGSLLCAGATQSTVALVDWDRFAAVHQARHRWPLLERVAKEARTEVARVPSQPSGGADSLQRRLSSMPRALRAAMLASHVQAKVGLIMGLPPAQFDPDRSFNDLGIDSMMAVELRGELNALGASIPLKAILNNGCVSAITELVLQQLDAAEPATAAPKHDESLRDEPSRPHATTAHEEVMIAAQQIRSERWLLFPRARPAAEVRLICFPYAGGGSQVFSDWAADLPDWIELAAVQLPGRGSRLQEPAFLRMEAMADALVKGLLPWLSEKPFAFFGHCLGALVMHEVARRLRSEHAISPAQMIVSGARAPDYSRADQLAIDVEQYSPLPNVPGHELPDDLFLDMLRDLNFGSSEALYDDPEMRSLMLPVVRADFEVYNLYTCEPAPPLDVPITAIGGRVDPFVNGEHVLGWRRMTTNTFSARFCPGDHYFIKRQRNAVLALIRDCLARHHLAVQIDTAAAVHAASGYETKGESRQELRHATTGSVATAAK